MSGAGGQLIEPAAQDVPDGFSTATATATATVIGRSFSFRLGAQVLSALINVAGMVVLGNYLAAGGYGEYAFYYALVPLIASLSDLGIGVIVTREIARSRDLGPRYLGDALLVKGVVSAAALLAVALTAPRAFDPAHAALVILVTATALVDFTQDVGVWVFRAHDRQDLEALSLMVSQVAWIAGIVLCAALGAPLPLLLATATLAFVIRLAVGAVVVTGRFYRPVFEVSGARLRMLVAEGLPFGLAMFAVVLYGRVGVLLLKGLSSDADVAYFSVGYMLSQPLGFVSSAFNVSAFPSLSRAARLGPAAVRPVLRSAVKFQFLAAFPLSVGLCLLSERVVPLLLRGQDFRQAGLALMVVSLGLVPIFLNLMSRYALAALDRQRAYLAAILVGLGANVAMSVVLIRSLGFVGACIGLLVGELAVLLVCLRALARYLPATAVLREAVRPLAAALGMGVVVFLIRDLNLLVAPVIGALVYVVLLLLLRALSSEELGVLRGIYVSFRLPGSGWLARSSRYTSHPGPVK